MYTKYFFFISTFLSTYSSSFAQKENIKIVKKQEGIVVLKIALCSSIDDKHCLVTQDIYMNKTRFTLVNF